MDQKDFLARVLPVGNHYIAFPTGRVGANGRSIFGHSAFVDPSAGVAIATRQANRGTDVFVALASFKHARVADPNFAKGKASRKQDNVEALKCLWLDIDFKNYDSPETAVAAIAAFLTDSKLEKPSIVVNSGGGVHVYWTFAAPLPFAEWQPLADGLAGLAENLGLKADLGVTIDSARILRMPGTLNLKYDPPRLCEVTSYRPEDVDLAAMSQRLRGVTSIRARSRPRLAIAVDPTVAGMFQDSSADDLGQGLAAHDDPYQVARMVKAGGCPMLADMLARNGNGDSRELWNNMLLLTVYAEDGRAMAHELSRGDPRYTAGETDAEFDMKLADRDTLGPTTCDTFSRSYIHCNTCPHRGKIKSPIVLGRPEAEPVALRLTPTWSAHGKTWRWTMVDEPEGPRRVAVEVFDLEMAEPSLSDIPGDARLELRFWKDGVLRPPVIVECGKMYGRDYLANLLSSHSVVAGRKLVVEALMSWVTLLRNESTEANAPPFGWSAGGFSLSGDLYTPDGEVRRVGLTHDNVTNGYGVMGEPEVWQQIAGAIIQDPRTELQILLATAFAAPLIEFTELSSTAVVIRSPKSGVGKTSVMKLARAVYGDPDDMAQATDTPMAVEMKLATLTNMPWYWDEVKVSDAKKMSDTIYQILQGKSKARGRPDGSLRGTHKTHGMLVMATNLSMSSLMHEASKGTDAGNYRVFELELPARMSRAVDSIFSSRMGKLGHNYGHVGAAYAAYLATHRAEAQSAVEQITAAVDKTFSATEAERYWTTSVKVIIAGALLATHAGVCTFDVKRMFDHLRGALDQSRTSATTYNAPEDLASRIWRFFDNRSLITDEFHLTAVGKPRLVTTEPPIVNQTGAAKVRLAYATNDLLISKEGVREYARRHNHEPELLFDQLATISRLERTSVDKGVSAMGSKTGREWVYILNAENVLGDTEMQQWVTSAAARRASSRGSSSGSAPSGSTVP